MATLFNITTELHTAIKMDCVLADYLFCMSFPYYYPEVDLSLMHLANQLVQETGVGYHMLDLSSMSFEFYSYGSIPQEEQDRLSREHLDQMFLEHDLYMEANGIYY